MNLQKFWRHLFPLFGRERVYLYLCIGERKWIFDGVTGTGNSGVIRQLSYVWDRRAAPSKELHGIEERMLGSLTEIELVNIEFVLNANIKLSRRNANEHQVYFEWGGEGDLKFESWMYQENSFRVGWLQTLLYSGERPLFLYNINSLHKKLESA